MTTNGDNVPATEPSAPVDMPDEHPDVPGAPDTTDPDQPAAPDDSDTDPQEPHPPKPDVREAE